jgi:hypothetical protein
MFQPALVEIEEPRLKIREPVVLAARCAIVSAP